MVDPNNRNSGGTVTEETLDERLKRLEQEKRDLDNQNRGMIRDLQSEREKRHALEARIDQMEQTLTSAGTGERSVDEKVALLAKDPDNYIASIVEDRLRDSEKRLMEIDHQTRIDQAYAWLAEQMGTTVSKLKGSDDDKEVGRIVSEYGLSEIDPRIGVKSAYKIFLQEKTDREESEKKRHAAIAGNATESVRSPVQPGSPMFTAADINAMSPQEYERNREKILEANAKGLIKR